MTKNPTVSVIIPTYNRVHLISRAIRSVLDQSYQDFEIIVVDDDSTDNIEEVVKSFKDKRIKFVKHEKNKGGGAARNTGIRVAQGELIAFLDSDDEWLPEKLEEQINLFSKIMYSSAKILICCKCIIHGRFRKRIEPKRGIKNGERISDYLFVSKGFIQTTSILVTKNLAKECLFDEELPRHQDYDLLCKIEKAGTKIFFIDKPLTIVHWDEPQNFKAKGWTPAFSEFFANTHRKFFSEKGYWNFLFANVVVLSAKEISIIYSFKRLLKINLKQITFRNYMYYCRSIILLIISGLKI